MTKKTFLEKLEKKLSILNKEEKKDIIDEYRSIIDEKIKHGMKEEEAVADFGDFDEFVSEILSAYKIDPQINKEKPSKEKAQNILDTGEELIKEGAKKLSDATEKIVTNIKESNEEITIELIFELLLKGLCALIVMGVLTLPFYILSEVGSAVLGFVLFPLDRILKVIWKVVVSLFYLATCAFLIINMFKGYIKSPKKEVNKKKKEEKVSNLKKEESKKEEKVQEKKDSSISNLLIILLKLFILFFFLFPIWIFILLAFLFLAVVFYFLLKGIGVLGIFICTLSVIVFLILLSRTLYNGIFHNAKIHLYPFIITLVFALIGAVMTFDFFTSIDYFTTPPNAHMEKKIYVTELTKPILIDEDFTLVVDNSIEDYKAVIEVSYYDEFADLEKEEIVYPDKKEIDISSYLNGHSGKEIYNLVIENLKQNKVYDYDELDTVSITIKVNENMQNLILKD